MKRNLLRIFPLILLALSGCMGSDPENEVPASGVEEGVSLELAQHRKNTISDLQYMLSLDIPAEKDSSIQGKVTLRFRWKDPEKKPLQIDFAAPAGAIHYAANAAGKIDYTFENGHLVISPDDLKEGSNDIALEFTAGNASLNRNDDYLYTLFVPDRAQEAFPCFDQPNLKARYSLELTVPESWTAVANGPGEEKRLEAGGHQFVFAETKPISTYLFSFAAGEFESTTQTRNGREMKLYHREDDSAKVARNLDAVFDLHFTSLEWLESYTSIKYPFEKFDFVLVPSFQYGGMEHPGAILYRASSLFLEDNATQDEQLRRASLIAHETAHMWFGDLVTMDWFNDVWLKEVFANFMAAKIVNPAFPDINHPLRFFFAHYPDAYAVDRSEGTHPVRQELANLKDAGTLYGSIIYKKAPIVMRQLEMLIGEKAMRQGLQEYLQIYSFGNAVWGDLVTILDRKTNEDLKKWSQVWVEEAGRPDILLEWQKDSSGVIQGARLRQRDPSGAGKAWQQQLEVLVQRAEKQERIPVQLGSAPVAISALTGKPEPDMVLFNSAGYGYGNMLPPQKSVEYMIQHLHEEPDPLLRGTAMATLWDVFLSGEMWVSDWIQVLLMNLEVEDNPQNLTRNLAYLSTTYWKFLTPEERVKWSKGVNLVLWLGMTERKDAKIRLQFFRSYRGLGTGQVALPKLYDIWKHEEMRFAQQKLGERDITALAFELAVRGHRDAEAILDEQATRIENPDRKARFEFIRPALSADAAVRDRFFASLKDPANRAHEPWVLTALRYLHHPLRATSAEKHLLPSLELLEEIQATGDIFFPGRWVDATFSGHRSPAAAQTVRDFLAARPDYPYQLKRKILQGADLLLRVAVVRKHH